MVQLKGVSVVDESQSCCSTLLQTRRIQLDIMKKPHLMCKNFSSCAVDSAQSYDRRLASADPTVPT